MNRWPYLCSMNNKTLLKIHSPCWIKQTPSCRYYLLKNVCWILPFLKMPLFTVDWQEAASSRRFRVCKARFRPKSYSCRTCITFGQETSFANSKSPLTSCSSPVAKVSRRRIIESLEGKDSANVFLWNIPGGWFYLASWMMLQCFVNQTL